MTKNFIQSARKYILKELEWRDIVIFVDESEFNVCEKKIDIETFATNMEDHQCISIWDIIYMWVKLYLSRIL